MLAFDKIERSIREQVCRFPYTHTAARVCVWPTRRASPTAQHGDHDEFESTIRRFADEGGKVDAQPGLQRLCKSLACQSTARA